MSKKQPPKRGDSRGRRGVYLRIPHKLHEKLLRLVALELKSGNSEATINGVVSELIEKAPELTR